MGWLQLRCAHRSGRLGRGVVPPGRTTPRGRVGGRTLKLAPSTNTRLRTEESLRDKDLQDEKEISEGV